MKSKAALNRRNWQNRKWSAFFEYTDREGVKRIGKGRKYNIEGQEIELFPSSVLVGMLHRQIKTLYAWERDFGFPRAMFQVREDKHCKRWYSRRQLVAIRTIYESFGNLRRGHYEDLPKFIAATKAIFYTIDKLVKRKEDGTILEN